MYIVFLIELIVGCVILACDLYYLAILDGILMSLQAFLIVSDTHKQRNAEPMHSLGSIRHYLQIQQDYYDGLAWLLHWILFLLPWRQDVGKIIAFDEKIAAGEHVLPPKLRTQRAQKLFSEYIRLLEETRTETLSTAKKQQIIDQGGWHCRCGRYNPAYTATCVCGKNKRDIPFEFQQKVTVSEQTPWHCSCGRENQHYVSTCVCGKNKRDIT